MTVVSGVVLAAGASTRLGRPKQLLLLDDEPLIRWTVIHALESKLSEVIVVVGGAGDAVAFAVEDLPVWIVSNDDYADGQSTSLIAGLAAVSPAADGVIFLLGDQPEVEPRTIDYLVRALHRGHGPIVQPVYAEQPGNPVLLARSLFPELAAVTGDEGARSIVRRDPKRVTGVKVPQPPPGDVDTEADYAALQERWARRRGGR